MTADPEYRRSIGQRSNRPAKLAGLSCDALRIRCDGQTLYSNCVAKGRSCSYVPSQKGGPSCCSGRKHRDSPIRFDTVTSLMEVENHLPKTSSKMGMPPTSGDEWVHQLGGLCGPGAGLRSVEMPFAEIDSIFDSIFGSNSDEVHPDPKSKPVSNPVRLYGSNEDILDAYYVFIHPYFPILPPSEHQPVSSRPLARGPPTFEPTSPLSLAISAILSLIPHPNERKPKTAEYLKRRREYAHCFAQTALGVIEKDYELLGLNQDSQCGLADTIKAFERAPFHPKLEVPLEGVVTLSILSIYEYAQRGNIDNMLQRANQALALAMSMALHEAVEEEPYADSKRRVWWMTYMMACQASAISGTAPAFDLYDPWFVTPYPKGWKLVVEAQQVLVESATFASDIDRMTHEAGDASWVSKRMGELDRQISSLLFHSRDAPLVSQMAPQPESIECMTTKTMRDFAEIKLHTARIKLHRLCAFQDILSGSTRHPDVPIPTDRNCRMDMPLEMSSNPILVADLSLLSRIQKLQMPFTSEESSQICLHAALNIVTLLDNLIYPNHTSDILANTQYARGGWGSELPRTMPTVVCCGVQSSYAMLMLSLKARALQHTIPDKLKTLNTTSLSDFRNELYHNLRLIVKFLENYSIAFEAIQGINDKLSQAIDREFLA
ncbi:C6 finger domain protein [Aspergillus bertholletiae]|uniref:C6 finger domain protein n=1 Tax=Aspergillus bertholletiae TaxID=1226010 RepID=A0A5N7AQ39_9EURO|nr:C6 finger domain protein [Aspergillus bertholletiae]